MDIEMKKLLFALSIGLFGCSVEYQDIYSLQGTVIKVEKNRNGCFAKTSIRGSSEQKLIEWYECPCETSVGDSIKVVFQ